MEAKNTPSQFSDVLMTFVGKRVVKMIRYSWWPKEQVASECDTADALAFSLTAGPLVIVFQEGSALGVASDPSLNSVIVWLDRVVDGKVNIHPSLDEDEDLFPIDSNDEKYSDPCWKQFMNQNLVGFSLLRKRSMNLLERELPSELGLCFLFGGDKRFIASHGLHNGSDDFSVLMDAQIEPDVGEKLEETPLLQ